MSDPAADPAHEPRLSKREALDESLIRHLIEGVTQVEAGRLAGCSDRTVRRRFEDPAFVSKYHARRRAVNDVARGRLLALQVEAVDTIGDLMANGESERVRLAAALEVMKIGIRTETEDLSDRVSALETEVHASGPTDDWDPEPLVVDPDDLPDE